MLDDEITQAFGNCFLFNPQGKFYPCNAKGHQDEVASLLSALYKELYKLKLVN